MRLYQLQDAIFLQKGKELPLKNEENEIVGFVMMEDVPGYEKHHTFSYTSADGEEKVAAGIKKSGFTRHVRAEYGVIAKDQTYELKDKLGNHFFYFCVTGIIDGKNILIEENWSGDLEVKVEKETVAYIRKKKHDLHAAFQFDEMIKENSLLFTVTILMYFMMKIYDKETEFVEYLIDS